MHAVGLIFVDKQNRNFIAPKFFSFIDVKLFKEVGRVASMHCNVGGGIKINDDRALNSQGGRAACQDLPRRVLNSHVVEE